ncbi:hypothetical protein [Marinobacterium arenosum]|uniref:hypothetical protein n=1 Tax=Marinobacterium arenosum TaxID=2862496 RepID=UPI001C96F00C|nr:hypothetical protein [Marinobacterium arenosum]MBY4679094.1 hypothetical protein [Marinobacterium arenosum]
MPQYDQQSQQALQTCHHDLQLIFNAVGREIACDIQCGYRNEAQQEQAFAEGQSSHHWPDSEHNEKPSMALDILPQGYSLDDPLRWCWFGGYVKGLADRMYAEGVVTHRVRWDGDQLLDGADSANLPHFEIYLPEKR